MQFLFDKTTHVFDSLHRFWADKRTHKFVSGVLVVMFLLAIAGIELNRQGMLPPFLARLTPVNHFYAVSLAFSLVLILEVISLIFILPCSLSKSLGKQFEILALILLRNSFKELVHFPEPVVIQEIAPLLRILSDGIGALIIFILLGVYYRVQPKRDEIKGGESLYRFVASKKLVSLVLLATFIGLGVYNSFHFFTGGLLLDVFPTFYTVLIFADILLVLISQQYLPGFHAVFRNSGFALSTMFIRLALAAPAYYNAAIGISAALFAVFLSLAYNVFYTRQQTG
ncbi:MAG: hypothetical protein ACLFNV_06630 [Desulfovibrionales bacterium]